MMIYLITGEPANDAARFLAKLEFSLQAGIKLVQLRAKKLSPIEYKKLAIAAVLLCHQYNAKILLNTHLDLVSQVHADGIHLPSADLMRLRARPFEKNLLFSASCHNEEQIKHAIKVDADLITLSPIFSTPSSPQGIAMGWEKFAKLAQGATMPVYALGGVSPKDLEIAHEHGAFGIAAIRSIWDANG